MPLTSAEKMKRYRERLKEMGKYDDYKKKHLETVNNSRKKKKEDIEKLSTRKQKAIVDNSRAANRARVAKCRALKQARNISTQSSESSPPFKTANSLGKAVAKLARGLHRSPRKQVGAVRKLYEKIVVPTLDQQTTPRVIHPRTTRLSSDVIDLVESFYERDDISRQAPGIKDVITVRNADGLKTKLQTRHLCSSISETHKLFSADHPTQKVGKSKFFELRPRHVLLSSQLPHNVCLCKYHSNFIYAIEAFHKYYSDFPTYSFEFPGLFLCPNPTTECWALQCSLCKSKLKVEMEKYVNEEQLADCKWYVWKEDNGRYIKAVEEGTSSNLAEYIVTLTPQFFEHCFVKREQALAYQLDRSAVSASDFDPSIALLQADFSENYTCISQDEIQSAHWHQSQVSLFTASIWHSGKQFPVVLASDNLTHSRDTIVAYMSILLETLPDSVKEVRVWSDGPSSQFKNRFLAAAIVELEQKYNKKIIWNFFATSHGKGPVDGIGGAVKRQVRSAVMSRKFTVVSAAQFCMTARASSDVKVIDVTDKNIKERNAMLNLESIIKYAKPIHGISKIHAIRITDGEPIAYHLTKDVNTVQPPSMESDEDMDIELQEQEFPLDMTPEINLSIDDYVEVDYDGQHYPGIINEIGTENDFKIRVMVKVGKYWKWPEIPDEIFYPREKILRKISAPQLLNARSHFSFKELA